MFNSVPDCGMSYNLFIIRFPIHENISVLAVCPVKELILSIISGLKL